MSLQTIPLLLSFLLGFLLGLLPGWSPSLRQLQILKTRARHQRDVLVWLSLLTAFTFGVLVTYVLIIGH